MIDFISEEIVIQKDEMLHYSKNISMYNIESCVLIFNIRVRI